VDDDGAVGSVQHDHFEQVACLIGTEDQVADRVVIEVFDSERVAYSMLDPSTATSCRSADLKTSTTVSYYRIRPVL
jgi:hypothetical protein